MARRPPKRPPARSPGSRATDGGRAARRRIAAAVAIAASSRPRSSANRSSVALPDGRERRIGPADRRAVPRGPDRRAGPATAARMARVRIGRDVDYIRGKIGDGDWREVVRVVGGIAGEVGSLLLSAGIYPLGLIGIDVPNVDPAPSKRADLPLELPPHRNRRVRAPLSSRGAAMPAEARPVVLVHGWFHNRTGMTLMARRLRAAGRSQVFPVDLPTATSGVQKLAAILGAKVDRIRELTGATQVDLVAHSLGGLVARWWLHHMGGAATLRNLVTLGSPHRGTAMAAFVPIGSGKAVAIGSDVVRGLDLPPPDGVRVTSIWSDMDYLILPPDDTDLPGPRNGSVRSVRVTHVGHLSLLYSRKVFDEVLRALADDG